MRHAMGWLVLALLGIAVMIGCGGPPPQESGVAPAAAPRRAPRPATAGQAAPSIETFMVTRVRISPETATTGTDLTAEPEVRGVPEGAEVEFDYRWFVNENAVEDASGATLLSTYFNKKQWVWCEVRARMQGQETLWERSQMKRIANSPPRIEPIPTNDFSLPGRFTYAIGASDADGDTLSYDLIAPLDAGIVIDPATGQLAWDVTEEVAARFGPIVSIRFLVTDGDGGRTSASLDLELKRTR